MGSVQPVQPVDFLHLLRSVRIVRSVSSVRLRGLCRISCDQSVLSESVGAVGRIFIFVYSSVGFVGSVGSVGAVHQVDFLHF